MGLYSKKQSLPRKELKRAIRGHSGQIPGTGGRKYNRREREGLTRSAFGPKYGSQISKEDYRKAIRELHAAKNTTKDIKAREKIDERVRYLKELGGKNI